MLTDDRVRQREDLLEISPALAAQLHLDELLPKVLEAAVVGIPYEHQEQAVRAFVKAFIVLKHGEKATEEEIRRLCEERLDGYKIPERIEFRAELPKSMVGKVLRRMLAEEEEKRMDGEHH